MRYQRYPEDPYFPFFKYYYELTHDHSIPSIKNIFFNNVKSDLKSLCLFEGDLKFS
jgi:hypothetical protein